MFIDSGRFFVTDNWFEEKFERYTLTTSNGSVVNETVKLIPKEGVLHGRRN